LRNLLLFLLSFFFLNVAFSQGLRQDFTIRQKSEFYNLNKLVGEHYEIIYTTDNIILAKEVLDIANSNTMSIENLLGYRLSGKIEIRLFENQIEYESAKNTLSNSLNIQQNTGGNTVIFQNDFDLVFNGSRESLQIQIRAGIANALLSELLFGGTVQEKIKYATMMQLPNWFINGLVQYIAAPWNANNDDDLRDLILSNEKFQISDLQPELQSLIGKNIWMFMSLLKGENAFQRILYLVRLTRKIENATYFVFNWNTSELLKEWHYFVLGAYSKDQKRKMPQQSEKLANNTATIQSIIKSKNVYYVQQLIKGKSCLYQYDLLSKNSNQIKTPACALEAIIPIYCSDENGGIFQISLVNKSYHLFHYTEGNWKEQRLKIDLDYVQAIQYHSNSKIFLIAGLLKSDNVIISCDDKHNVQTLFMSEQHIIDPIWHANGETILFSSLVSDNKSTKYNYDIFELSVKDSPISTLVNLTNSLNENETTPTYYSTLGIAYLSDKNGIINSYLKLDSNQNRINNLTDYQRNIQLVYYDMPSSEVVEVLKIKGNYNWFISVIDTNADLVQSKNTLYTYFKEEVSKSTVSEKGLDSLKAKTDTFDIGIYFQTDFPEEVDFRDINADSLGKKMMDGFESFVISNPSYIKPKLLITQLDNGWFNNYYEPTYKFIDEALLIPIGVNVALNYREIANKYNLSLGARIARNFNQFGYFLKFDAFKYNIPYKVELFRQSKRLFRPNDSYNKVITNQLSISALIYAQKNLNLNLGWVNRYDIHNILSATESSLKQKNIQRNYTGPSIEFIYNDSKEKTTNIFIGSKIKIYGQGFFNTSKKHNCIILEVMLDMGLI